MDLDIARQSCQSKLEGIFWSALRTCSDGLMWLSPSRPSRNISGRFAFYQNKGMLSMDQTVMDVFSFWWQFTVMFGPESIS